MRKGGDNVLGNPVGEEILLNVAHIGAGQHCNRRLVWEHKGGLGDVRHCFSNGIQSSVEDGHRQGNSSWLGHVLPLLVARHIGERQYRDRRLLGAGRPSADRYHRRGDIGGRVKNLPFANIRGSRTDLTGELVASPGDCPDQLAVGAKGFAKRDNLAREPVLFDDPALPNLVQQLVLADHRSRGFDQRHQHIESPAAEGYRPAFGEQLAAMREDAEVAEFDARRRVGRANHGRDYKPYSIKSHVFACPTRARGDFRSRST